MSMFYNEFRLTPSNLRAALDRDGEMSRLRAMTGLRISNSPSAGTYIIEKKIRNILAHYANGSDYASMKKTDRMVSRMDKLSKTDLEYLYFLGTEESVADMISVLSLTQKKVNELATAWKDKMYPPDEPKQG